MFTDNTEDNLPFITIDLLRAHVAEQDKSEWSEKEPAFS